MLAMRDINFHKGFPARSPDSLSQGGNCTVQMLGGFRGVPQDPSDQVLGSAQVNRYRLQEHVRRCS